MDEQEKTLVEELLKEQDAKKGIIKSLFMGALDPSLFFPFPKLEEKSRFVEKVREIGKTSIDAKKIDQTSEIPQEVIDQLAEAGILGMTLSKEYGGSLVSQVEYCQVMEELSSHCGSCAIFVNAHQSIGLKALALFGTEEQKKTWLPELASGKKLAAFSLTEPNAGSDAAGIETVAVDKGDHYLLHGQKQWTTNGSIADLITIMAKVEGKVTAFLVPSTTPGLIIKDKALEKCGIRGTKTTNFLLKDVVVPKSQVLGPIGGGLRVCLTCLDYGRVTFGATCLGVAKRLRSMAEEHAKSRIQFRKRLEEFPLIQWKLQKIRAYTEAMHATTYMTAHRIDLGQEDMMLEAAVLKLFASEALWDMIYETMQIYGGKSFFTDLPLERLMRDARLNMIGEGANEVLRLFVAACGLREVGKKLFSTLQAISPFVLVHLPIEQPVKFALEKRIKQFKWVVLYHLFRYREEVVEEQLQLNRVCEMALALYTTLCTVSAFPESRYPYFAFASFDQAFHAVFSNNDQKILP